MPDRSSLSISASLRMAKASSLAQRGRLREAEGILAPPGTIPDNPIELQALAALVTREGDYHRAMSLWKNLLEQQPSHPEAREMIGAIELWLSRPSWYGFIPVGGGIALGLILALVLFFAFAEPDAPVPKPRPAAPAQSLAPAPSKSTQDTFVPIKLPEPKKRKPNS